MALLRVCISLKGPYENSRGNLSKVNLVRGINEMVSHSFQLYDFTVQLR